MERPDVLDQAMQLVQRDLVDATADAHGAERAGRAEAVLVAIVRDRVVRRDASARGFVVTHVSDERLVVDQCHQPSPAPVHRHLVGSYEDQPRAYGIQ